ncbi:MAG: LURP-one-related family protein [Saprospiraceae bacterium]|nr:LURP-one-related family protein [Saprospiraceae bacterium]|tara:strand:+ start:4564 stop:5058 length:495 start_codon:yes stop_codon:yes gene_type:complete
MKHYKIEQKPFAIGGKYIITDDQGHEEYMAKGKPFSFRKHTSLADSLGNVTYEFHRQLFSWKQNFFIHENGDPAYRLFKNRVSIPPEIFIESLQDSDAFYVKGNFWGMEYDFYKGEEKFASVSKNFPSFVDTYHVKIDDGHDDALVLTIVLIIDVMKDSKKKKG